jgi:sulfite exporter TauE/SafE
MYPFGIGTSIVLIAVGAILRYAVNVNSSAVNIETVGLILMIVGIVGLVLSVLFMALWHDRRREAYYDRDAAAPPPTRDPYYR